MIYIFDLDNTLYTNNILYNNNLNKKLKYLKNTNRLFLFSNNTQQNGELILKKMKLKSMFHKKIFLGDLNISKPEDISYLLAISFFKLHKHNSNIIFFDDKLSNLKVAKKQGWITCLINNNFNKNKLFIDYRFADIVSALDNFIPEENLNKINF